MLGILAIIACSTHAAALDNDLDLTVDGDTTYQTIDGFGTCCSHWTAGASLANPEVRRLWSEDLRCSILRFPIPTDLIKAAVDPPEKISYKAFTFSQGDSQVLDFLQAQVARDPAIKTLGTAWSPPGWTKTNGVTGQGGSLRKDRIPHYAEYLSQVVLYLRTVRHVPVYAVSPQNELVFKEFYDSCVYTPALYAAAVAAIGASFDANGIHAKILGPEDMTDADDRVMSFIRAIAARPDAKDHFDIAASHGYVNGILSSGSADSHNALWKDIEPTGLPLWMTETSGESPKWLPLDAHGHPGYGALTLGMKIHNALVYGHCSAWIYWCFTGDFKNGAAAGESLMNLAQPTKKYFVSKQFYRWIRPDAKRIAAGPDGTQGVMISAYQQHGGALTIVLINSAAVERPVHLHLQHVHATTLHAWRTSETEDCVAVPEVAVRTAGASLILPPGSVTTLTSYTERQIALAPLR
jgi:glucuronoarabinoxylan endo-1,4-beta-xylanase